MPHIRTNMPMLVPSVLSYPQCQWSKSGIGTGATMHSQRIPLLW